jgi:transcriptional regulator with XRE-family HTH domain
MEQEESFGQRLARVRDDAGLSQSALARAVGTSQSAISQIESGERNPSFETIRQIARALSMTPAQLLGGPVLGLQPEEEAHFRLLRQLSDEAREELSNFARYLSQRPPKRPV